MSAEESQLLKDFIEDEENAQFKKELGVFLPKNFAAIIQLISKAPELLPDGPTRILFYYHLLRNNISPALKDQAEFARLQASYEMLLPLLGNPAECSLDLATGLLLFGFDEKGKMFMAPEEDEIDGELEHYQRGLRIRILCNSYDTLADMLSDPDSFKAPAETGYIADYVLDLLQRTGYNTRNDEWAFFDSDLFFWGLIFIAIQNTKTAEQVVQDFIDRSTTIFGYPEKVTLLSHFLEAAQREDLKAKIQLSKEAESKVLLDFIADERKSQDENRWGEFLKQYYSTIMGLTAKAVELLPEGPTRLSLYYHLLRNGILPYVPDLNEFLRLQVAYQTLTPLIGDHAQCRLDHEAALLVFGFDGTTWLTTTDKDPLTRYQWGVRVWRLCNDSEATLKMLDDQTRFQKLADTTPAAANILEIFRTLRYQPFRQDLESMESERPVIWALVFVTILNSTAADQLVHDFINYKDTIFNKDLRFSILARFLEAANRNDLRSQLTGDNA